MELYHSPWEAYPFLSDAPEDLRCDFELLTDEIASRTGLLRSQMEDETLRAELLRVCELVYHANPTLRTRFTVTPEEIQWLADVCERLRVQSEGRCTRFVLPQGCTAACTAHILRVQCKALVRCSTATTIRATQWSPLCWIWPIFFPAISSCWLWC